eukprot:5638264-Pleurochrysis_carterae.AAC.2
MRAHSYSPSTASRCQRSSWLIGAGRVQAIVFLLAALDCVLGLGTGIHLQRVPTISAQPVSAKNRHCLNGNQEETLSAAIQTLCKWVVVREELATRLDRKPTSHEWSQEVGFAGMLYCARLRRVRRKPRMSFSAHLRYPLTDGPSLFPVPKLVKHLR